ncbi:MAG: thiamine phosphate synthase, partial [Rhodospirillales bacterium]
MYADRDDARDDARDDGGTRLYLVTPPAFEPAAFADTLAQALDADDVAALQLRLKGADDDQVRRAAEA